MKNRYEKIPYIIAISGVKNSGKTSFIEKMIPLFAQRGIKVGVLKHDGHRFSADVPGTDSYRFLKAGSTVSAVFDEEKYMITSVGTTDENVILNMFPDVDIILLEGFKNSTYDKLEIIREGNSAANVCSGTSLKGIITDFQPELSVNVPVFPLNLPEQTVDYILKLSRQRECDFYAGIKLMLYGEQCFFGPGAYELLKKVGEFGSIRKAAMDMGLSYTKAWKIVKRAEEATDIQFLVRSSGGKNGGSSTLTEKGQFFLTAYEQFLNEMRQQSEHSFRKYFRFLDRNAD